VGGVFLALWGVLVTGTIDNVLKPVLARGGVEIHGAVIFFAMIGGIVMYGALGLIVGPLAVSLFLALVAAVERERAARGADRDPGALAALRRPAGEVARRDA
jgi:predicted PurR-regulated permease PerM